MIPRMGTPPLKGQVYRRRIGAYALIARGENLLLTIQHDPGPDLQMPGGGVDSGESPLAALHREVLEETGWRIARPRRVGAYRRFTFMPEYDLWAEKICLVFLARPALRIGPPAEHGHTPVWMPADIASQSLGNSADRHFAGLFATRQLSRR